MANKPDNTRKLSADKIVVLPIAEVRPYEKNPRKNEKAVKYVKESIRQFGFKVPIVIDSNRVIVCGHTRLLAAKSLGMTEVPCIMADDLTDDQVKAFRLADNKVGEFAEWDMDILGDELDDIADASDIDMEDFGFDLSGDDEETEIVEDEVPEEVEPVCQRGEIWQLGEHRLMCGDSTSADDVAKLMNGEMADLVFTDPPYGISTKGGRQQTFAKRGMTDIENDNRIGEDLVGFLTAVFNAMPLADDASVYVCYPWKTQAEFTEAIRQSGLTLKACIVWDKKVFGLNGSQHGYRPQHELIYFACKGNYKWYGDKSQSDIWQVSREINREEQGNHPTPKPVALCGKAIVNSSTGTDIVLDLFGGSGSTLIACEQLNRKCRMVELEPHYCDVIIARWEKLTGQKAVKVEV